MNAGGAQVTQAPQAPLATIVATDAGSRALVTLTTITLVVGVFLLFWPTTKSLMVSWENTVDRTYTHGYLILAICLWLLWRARARLDAGDAQFSSLGAVGLVGGALVWLIAWRAGLQIVHQALIPLLICAAVMTCLGWSVFRRVWLPIGYLYFAIPIWDAINPALQWISVFAVRGLLRLVGIPAYFAENTFQIPAGAFEIADGCSGLHFFIVGVAIAILYGEVNRDTIRTRVMLVAFAALLAMATNWVRILIIVLAGHLTDMQHYLVAGEHYSFGWFMFAGAMLLFFLVVRRWPLSETQEGGGSGSSALDRPRFFGRALATLALVAFVPTWNALDARGATDAAAHAMPEVESWRRTDAPSSWHPIFARADVESIARFEIATASVDLYTATYLQQRQGKEVSGYGTSIFGDSLRAVSSARAVDGRWNELRAVDSRGEEWLFRFSYRIDERWFTSALRAQLTYGVRSMFGAPLSSVVVLRTACNGDCESARAVVDDFIQASESL